MKNVIFTLLVLAATAFAQEPAQQPTPPAGAQPQAGAQTQPAAPAQQKKEIKDPAEYNAYMSAVNQTDPAAKAAALESFLQQYPNSVMKTDAMELLMAAYDQAGNAAKTTETAQRLLQVDASNVRALALLAFSRRTQGQQTSNPQLIAEAAQYGQRGVEALKNYSKPEGVSDADVEKLKTQLSGIFNGALGINSLQNKDYASAQRELRTAVEVSPNDIQLVYPLALAYLTAAPPDNISGLWFVARAANLAPTPQAQQQIAAFGRSRYIKYHGGEDGWNELLTQTKTEPLPAAGFTIKPAPTPAEQAQTLVSSKPVDQMSFGDFQMIFTSGNQQAADTVWNAIKDKPLAIEGKAISVTPTKLMIAATVDDIQANKPDIELTMVGPIPRTLLPKGGATIQFQGTPVSYTAQPSFLMQMNKGALIGKPAPPTPPKKKTPTKRRG